MAVRVLLLADSEVRNCIESLLTASGTTFHVECASQMEEVYDHDADVILGEIAMPGVPLFKAMSSFAELAQQRPVVIVSRINDASIARQAIRSGIQDYLPLDQIDHRQLARALLFAVDRQQRFNTVTVRDRSQIEQCDGCLPTWDESKRELRVGSVVVKRFHKPSPNQELILTAFEEQNWQHRIFDPIPYHPDICPTERLRATIRSLNQRHESPVIRFHGDGSGQAITWTFVAEQPSDIEKNGTHATPHLPSPNHSARIA